MPDGASLAPPPATALDILVRQRDQAMSQLANMEVNLLLERQRVAELEREIERLRQGAAESVAAR